MNSLLEQLHDIEGLDPISWWPLAMGWWIVIFTGILLLCLMIGYGIRYIAFKRSWKNDALKKLSNLEENLSDVNAKETIIALSDYLRRIAIRRFSRQACAGLTGEAWLKWLAVHDPKMFDWEKKGIILIDAPYSPLNLKTAIQNNKVMQDNEIKDLINAIRNWVV